MIFKVCTMILRLGFAIALSMLVASTQAYAFQESDLTTKVPPCKEKVSGPIKDKRGFLIPNPRLIDIDGTGKCEIIVSTEGQYLNANISNDPGTIYINRGSGYETFYMPSIDNGIQAFYYLKKGGSLYLIEEGGRERQLIFVRFDAKPYSFDLISSPKVQEAILRFHVHFMVEQAIKEINKGHVAGDVVALYVAMVQISADRSGDQYILEQQDILTNAMIGAANRAEAKKGIASKSKTNAQKVK